jgi:DNA-binding NtrC family response regulator
MKPAGEELPTGFVGRSPRIAQIRSLINKIGPGRMPVLIQGESGTGKEVAARSLYNASPVGAFVPIDCGAVVGPLMESELFGHTRNAFTGAGEAKRGLLELANGGTAFFDEIGDLPGELQVKLLRVLQEKEFRPVGSLQRMKVDVRIIAATHRNLEKEVKAGRFREDLYHRLNVIRVTLPPLRDRREDIPLLIERFLQSSGKRYILTHELSQALNDYDWPGNIRELKNCLDRMMAFNSGPLLHFADLPTAVVNHVRGTREPEMAMAASAGGAFPAPVSPIMPLHLVERVAIKRALDHLKWDRTEVAIRLGIGRTTLYRKIKEYELAQD